MRRCSRCVLPETFPGVSFDEAGVCNYCREHAARPEKGAAAQRAKRKFEELAANVRTRPGYHCLLAYSGGKDSTYTLWLLRERYGLRVLAVTFDNGFLSAGSFDNVRRIVEKLNVDHLLVKPRFDLLRTLFAGVARTNPFPPAALERASSICNACISLVKGATLRIAIEQRIPMIAYGWSPGQAPASAAIFRFNKAMLRHMQQARMAPLIEIAGDAVLPYMLTHEHLDGPHPLPYSVNPLAFAGYDEHRIIDRITKLGWRPPADTDGNSSNCLLNSFAIRQHLADHGFHPYAFEIAGLVREGVMTRAEGIEKIENLGSAGVAARVARRLGLSTEDTPS